MKSNTLRTALRGVLAVPAAALMLGAAEAGSTVALNLQSYYYDSGTIPQTVGFGNGYQTTGFPVTAKAFGVAVADWTNTAAIEVGVAQNLTGIPFAGLSVDLNATNLWDGPFTGPGKKYSDFGYDGWPPGSVIQSNMTPGNYEVAWSYLDNTGWDFTLNGLHAKFPNGYMVGLISGGGKPTATSSVSITENTNFENVGTVTFVTPPDNLGIGASPVLTDDSITFTNASRPSVENCAVAGIIVTDKPVVPSCWTTTPIVPTGGSFTVRGTALGIGILTYQWKRNGADIPGAAAKNINYTVSSASASDAGSYTLVVSSSKYPSNPATGDAVSVTVALPAAVTWDGNTGTSGAQDGAGTWDNTTTNWWNGSSDIAWSSTNIAAFGSGGSGPYTVSLGENISTVSGLTFNNGSYTIAPTTSETLTFAANQTITTTGDATISAKLGGSNGFTKAGSAKLTLSNENNPITGPVVVNAGTLSLSRGGGGSSLSINPGATATTAAINAIGYGTNCFTLNVNGGTFNLGVADNGIWSMNTNLQNATLAAVSGANWSYGGAGSAITNSGTSTISGGNFIFREDLPDSTLSITNTGNLTFNCPIDGGGRTLAIAGTGTTTLAAISTNLTTTSLNGGTLGVIGRVIGFQLLMNDGTALNVSSSGASSTIDLSGNVTAGSDSSEPAGTNTINFTSVTSTSVAPIKAAALFLSNPITINIKSIIPQVGQYPLMVETSGTYTHQAVTLGSLPPGITATLVDDLENTGMIYLNVTAAVSPSLNWTGAVNGVWDINTTNNWSPSKYLDGSIVNFSDNATNTNVTLGTAVLPAGMSFGNSAKNYTLSGTGGIGGSAGLTKTGTGNLLISTNNTYSGSVDISGGGTVTIGSGGTAGTLGGAGDVTLGASTLAFNRSDAVTLDRTITGSGGTVIKNGSGALTMSAPGNTCDITVNSGTLVASGGTFSTAFAAGKLITVNSGATLSTVGAHSLGSSVGGGDVPTIVLSGGNMMLGHEQYIRTLTMTAGTVGSVTTPQELRVLAGSVYTVNAAATSSSIGAPLSLYNPLSLVVGDGAAAADLVISGIISNTGTITKTGSGRVVFSGVNTYTGSTIVNGGSLAVVGTSVPDTNTLEVDSGVVDVTADETVNALYYGATQQAAGTYGSSTSSATKKDNTRFSGTAVLTVLTGPSAGFTAWTAANAPGQTFGQDHDGDGVLNGIEYFMGLSGSGFTANPGIVAGKVSWQKGAGYTGVYGSDFTVQTSVNLTTWTDVPVSDTNLNNASPLQYTLPTGAQKTFTRLKVTGP